MPGAPQAQEGSGAPGIVFATVTRVTEIIHAEESPRMRERFVQENYLYFCFFVFGLGLSKLLGTKTQRR